MEPSYSCESGRTGYPVVHHHHHPPMVLCPHSHHYYFHPYTNLCLHHHHHHHHCHRLRHRHRHHHHHHHQVISFHSHVTGSSAPLPAQNHLNSRSTVVQNESLHSADLVSEEQYYEYEEEEEPIFILTDDWRELFAKSEAKRRLDKMQAKKKQRN